MQPEIIKAQQDKNLYFEAIAWINKVLGIDTFLIVDKTRAVL
jgi:hypothetical protein